MKDRTRQLPWMLAVMAIMAAGCLGQGGPKVVLSGFDEFDLPKDGKHADLFGGDNNWQLPSAPVVYPKINGNGPDAGLATARTIDPLGPPCVVFNDNGTKVLHSWHTGAVPLASMAPVELSPTGTATFSFDYLLFDDVYLRGLAGMILRDSVSGNAVAVTIGGGSMLYAASLGYSGRGQGPALGGTHVFADQNGSHGAWVTMTITIDFDAGTFQATARSDAGVFSGKTTSTSGKGTIIGDFEPDQVIVFSAERGPGHNRSTPHIKGIKLTGTSP